MNIFNSKVLNKKDIKRRARKSVAQGKSLNIEELAKLQFCKFNR